MYLVRIGWIGLCISSCLHAQLQYTGSIQEDSKTLIEYMIVLWFTLACWIHGSDYAFMSIIAAQYMLVFLKISRIVAENTTDSVIYTIIPLKLYKFTANNKRRISWISNPASSLLYSVLPFSITFVTHVMAI